MSIFDQPSFELLRKRVQDLEPLVTTNEDKARLQEFKDKIHSLSTLPDRFNKVFSSKGWVAHESFSVPSMEKALRISKEKSVDIAEKYLLDYYNEKIIRSGITGLWGTEPFRDRLHLIKLAYDDFICGRYYACIPVLLMMVDGVVADAGNNMGFFSEKSDVTSWDSIAGHESGLQVLKSIYYRSRNTKNKNKITLPYRNGILHGRDLNYGNREVAAKCWALLFIIRDVLSAQRDEETRKKKHEIEHAKSVDDIRNDLNKMHNDLAEVIDMDSYKRKPVIVGIDYPESGDVNQYMHNSPEKAVAEFIDFWKIKNYGKMASLIFRPYYVTKSQMAGRMNKSFSQKEITEFKFIKSDDISSRCIDIETEIIISHNNSYPQIYNIVFRVLYCEKESTEPVVNPSKEGMWKIAENFQLIDHIGTTLELL